MVIVLSTLIGCDRDPMVRVYDAPKDPMVASSQSSEPKRFLIAIVREGESAFFIKASDKPERLELLADSLRQIAAGFKLGEDQKPVWQVPEDWQVLPGNEIATAILEAPAEGAPVRFVVTQLPIQQEWESYLEININRWRTQLGLPENRFAEQKPELIEVARENSDWPALLLDLTGTASTLPPRMGLTPPSAPSAPSEEKRSAKSAINYITPEGWNDEGASGIRAASFSLDGDKAKGEVTVIFAGGDRLSNIERWQGQLSPSAEPSAIKEASSKAIENATPIHSAKGIEGQLFSLLGPDGDIQPAMLAAILPFGQGESSVFVKLTSDTITAKENRDKLIAFISSLEW